MMAVVEWTLCFFFYSFLGWAYESLVCSIDQKKFVNRGFLNGPVCPVYGCGALVCILLLYQRVENGFVLFVAGMALTCTVEYITAVLLEKLFHAKWWDYSDRRFNLHGRVCLLGAVVFGTLSVLLIKVIQPQVEALLALLPNAAQTALASVLLLVLLTDLFITVRHLLRLGDRLKDIQAAINDFLLQYTKYVGELTDAVLDKFEESRFYTERIKRLFGLNRIQSRRIVRAFPNLRHLKYNDALQQLRKKLLGADDRK